MKSPIAIAVLLFLSACNLPAGGSAVAPETSERDLLGTMVAVALTETSRPTLTVVATETERSTETQTAIPPTATEIQPIVYQGTGDGIVEVSKNDIAMIIHVVGNSSSRHFAVENFGADGEVIDLLVNTTDPYDGIRPLDFYDDELTTRFQVSADGPWRIELLPLTAARRLDLPGVIEGNGDDVFYLNGTPDLAIIQGNEGSQHFAVVSYGDSSDLLVNTTDPYNGTVILDRETFVIEVDSEGSWRIEITIP